MKNEKRQIQKYSAISNEELFKCVSCRIICSKCATYEAKWKRWLNFFQVLNRKEVCVLGCGCVYVCDNIRDESLDINAAVEPSGCRLCEL
jgi:hypothetical protein